MTKNNDSIYWISPSGLYIELNALGESNYVQAGSSSSAYILCYVKDNPVLGYDDGHNYKRWKLTAYPTVFHDNVEKYVYVAIPRDVKNDTAMVVFPSREIDIEGKDSAGVQYGSTDYYYIWLQGKISAPIAEEGASVTRDWVTRISTGLLSSDEALDAGGDSTWWIYNKVTDFVEFTKTIYRATFKELTIAANGFIKFGEDLIKKVAEFVSLEDSANDSIVTPKYLKDREAKVEAKYLRKDQDDSTEYKLGVGELDVVHDADIHGNLNVGGDTELNQTLKVGEKAYLQDVQFGDYQKGISGGFVDKNADAELKSLVLRESLTVPELHFNRVEVIAGNTWRSRGGGKIEYVLPISESMGYAALRLEDGEIGAVAVDDKCQGVFHLKNGGNDSENSDTHNGNFSFAGFKTIYFKIVAVYDSSDDVPEEAWSIRGDSYQPCQIFKYELRYASDTTWTDATHPQPQMNFAQYANKNKAERQFVAYTTPEYHILLAGMTEWTYGSQNIQYIEGNLNGFTIKTAAGDSIELKGYGIAFGNGYQWGTLKQFDRARTLVSQQAHYLINNNGTTPPQIDDSGWSIYPTVMTKENPFLWMYYTYTYDDGNTSNGEVFLAGSLGESTVTYSLEIDEPSLKIDADGNYNVSLIKAYVNRNRGSEIETGVDYGYIRVLIDDAEDDLLYDNGENVLLDDGSGIGLSVYIDYPEGGLPIGTDGYQPQKSVKFVLFSPEGIALDVKSVSVVSDGKQGKPGQRGYNGAIVRRTEWEEGKNYYNGESGEDGNLYLDEVVISNGESGDSYLCKQSHLSSQENKPGTPGGVGFWEPINDMKPIKTPFADIAYAIIKYLQTYQLKITDADNNLYGVFGAPTEDNPNPLWFGGNAEDPVFAVSKEGAMHANVIYQGIKKVGFDGWNPNVRSLTNGAVILSADSPTNIMSDQYLEGDKYKRTEGIDVGWKIVLPYAGDCVGKVFDIYTPNHLQPRGYTQTDYWHQPILVTALDSTREAIIDNTTYNIPDGGIIHFGEGIGSFGLIMSSFLRRYGFDGNYSEICHVKVVAGERKSGETTYYAWYVLECSNCKTLVMNFGTSTVNDG